ncbi:MAG: aromatic amino acid transport family protein [Parachlamydiaceae bacterium]
MANQQSKMVGGILLISGTAVGAGMLALPISTGMAGFIPSVFLFALYSVYMTFTGLLMLEVNLWVGEGNNLISMAKLTLGRWGQAASWILYLFLLYSLTTAYVAGGGPLLLSAVKFATGKDIPEWMGMVPLLAICGFFVYKGARSVDLVNRALMVGMVATYALLVIFLTPHLNLQLLNHTDWKYLLIGVSITATSFGFHIVIPSLVTYMNRDIPKLRTAILVGSSIPFFVYLLWEFLALGIIPVSGKYGIEYGYQHGSNAAHLMSEFLQHSTLAFVTQCFSFFAIITSFFGVSLSLFDFLADGLNVKKTHKGKCFLFVLTFFPPLIIALIDPRAFLSALEYAGAFGVVALLGLMPAMMAWSGRYRLLLVNHKGFQAPGGKPALIATITLSLIIIAAEAATKLGWIKL